MTFDSLCDEVTYGHLVAVQYYRFAQNRHLVNHFGQSFLVRKDFFNHVCCPDLHGECFHCRIAN